MSERGAPGVARRDICANRDLQRDLGRAGDYAESLVAFSAKRVPCLGG